MIMGTNRIVRHGERDLHVQAEDLGAALGALELRVYHQGALLWHKRVPYADVLARNLPKAELEEALQALLEKSLLTVEAAIVKGRIG